MALTGAVQTASELTLPWRPYGTFGFSGTVDGSITAVAAGSPAANAGLRDGDRIDVAALGLHERRRLIYLSMAPPGERLTIPVIEGRSRRVVTLVATPYPRTLADNVTNTIENLERLAFLAIAVALVLLRPSLLTWTFFLIAAATQPGATPQAFLDDRWIVAYSIYANATMIAGAIAAVIFAMLFPRTHASRVLRNTALVAGAVGAALFIFDTANLYEYDFAWIAHGSAAWGVRVQSINNTVIWGLEIAAVLLFGLNYFRARSAERLRMQWVALGFAAGNASLIAPGLIDMIIPEPLIVLNLLLCLTIFTPLSVAYAILKHRVIDVRFFISRALVYGALTSIVVAVLALFDFAVSNRLEATRLGLAVEIAGAIAIGIGMNRLHGTIDALVDRYVFRSVHDAEKRLRIVGRAMVFAQTERAIDEMFASEAVAALRLTYSRVDRELGADTPLAMELQAERTPTVRGDDFIVPLFVRHRLLGCATFGPHTSGAAIDPNERTILERFAHDAAIAYDHVAAERSAAENAALREQLTMAQVRVDELRAAVRAQ